MTTTQNDLIPVAEFAARLGSPDIAVGLLDRHRVKLETLWDGRKALPAAAAGKILALHRAEVAENDQLHVEYAGYLRAREAEAAQVYRKSYAKSLIKYRAEQRRQAEELAANGSLGGQGWAAGGGFAVDLRDSPQTDSHARQAAREEAERWDRMHPEFDFETWKKKGKR